MLTVVKGETPLGPMFGVLDNGRLALSSVKASTMGEFLSSAQDWLGPLGDVELPPADAPLSVAFQADINRLLHGVSHRLELDLSRHTAFQIRVAEAVRDIPFGETATYGEIAAIISRPGGARAVGRALARLPFPLFIPAHRVVRSDALPAGLTLSTSAKRRALLAWERERSDAR
jgi:O-6-methylguanine DNA methyltransferase